MKRLLEQDLQQWKDSPSRMPLMIRGGRQVGKSYLIETFGAEYFTQLLTINFEQEPTYKTCFGSLKPTHIIQQLTVLSGKPCIPGKTLLFLDEIQECPVAIESLRYFKEQMPELHVIAAGSLLEFALQQADFSMPVGRIEFLYLQPLSFAEFLQATGNGSLFDFLQNVSVDDGVPVAIHQKALECLRLYMVLGGMPAVVDSYVKEQDLTRCQQLQAGIMLTYRNDFGKYASLANQQHCERIFAKAPSLVAKRFKYVDVDPDVQSRSLKVALQLLKKAGIVFPVYSVSANGLPLNATLNEKKFKLLFLDVGLVKYGAQIDAQQMLSRDLMLINNGALIEQFVGQELLAYQPTYEERELYYWHRENRNSSAEVDYVIRHQSGVIPIEVKSGKTGRLRSLRLFMDEKNADLGVKISTETLSWDGRVLSVPLYMVSQLGRLLGALVGRG